jgi:hypothetical protein
MDQNNFPLNPRHIGISSGVSKMIFEPMVHSTQTIHVSCVKINTMSKQTETSFHLTHPHHLGVPFCVPIKISLPVVCSAQTVHLPFTNINTTPK